MNNTNLIKKSPPAETSNSARAKLDKKKVKKIKSPDVTQMIELYVDARTSYFFYTKKKYNKKKRELGL